MNYTVSVNQNRLANALFNLAIHNAVACKEFDPESATKWCLLAAQLADKLGSSGLASKELEDILIGIAQKLQTPPHKPTRSKTSWLHVFTAAYEIGGHTALATRWILADDSNDQHSLLLTSQSFDEVPENLVEAVRQKNGEIWALGRKESLLDRAYRLREIAWNQADIVVLHIHMWDIIPSIALGVPNGPPVVLLNHADHTFWVGSRIADKVVSIRDSGQRFTQNWRGVCRNAYLPLPLKQPSLSKETTRESTRKSLEIPFDAVIFLTIGTSFKYIPINNLSFLELTEKLLEELPNAYLVAIGPNDTDVDWAKLSRAASGRVRALGPKPDLDDYFSAADVYLEGFPFGSLTALLEAGLAGLPYVRAPKDCPPPFTSDGEAFQNVPQPESLEAYLEEAKKLAISDCYRNYRKREAKTSIGDVHLGEGWLHRLAEFKRNIPESHSIYPAAVNISTPPHWENYWIPYLNLRFKGDPLLFFYVRARQLDLIPQLPYRLILQAVRTETPYRPASSPNPFSLKVFAHIINPVGHKLSFSDESKGSSWWPLVIIKYWYRRYFGWRFNRI